MAFCGISCFISIIFLIANIYTMMCIGCSENKNKFIKLLSNKQKNIYFKIIMERRNIYFQGYGLGFIISAIFIFIYKILPKSNKKLPYWSIICIAGAITLIINYFYYILSPKSTYMISHLNNKNQIDAWLDIYRMMQVKYHSGLVLGIIAVMIFAHANNC